MERYTEGSIVRIKLENFLTYNSVEFTCGPRLNVIIGPNGTGKSTIVCGICLGLAGKPGLIGRAQNASDFIKYGENKAKVELELQNADGENWVICREINKDNTSKWSVNKRNASLKSVEELVGKLNIQIGNLTQFLPQEKVADFAKMTEIELLENTQKGVGDLEMYERHQKLKESRNSAKALEQDFQTLSEKLELEIQKNNRIKQDVENFQEREKFLTKIKFLKMKKIWMEYDYRRKEYVNAKEQKQELEGEFKKARKLYAPLQNKIDKGKTTISNMDSLMKNTSTELREVARKAEACGKEGDNLADRFVEIHDEFKFKKDQEENRKKRLRDLHKQLSALENDLQNTADEGQNVKPQLDAVTKNLYDVTKQLSQLHSEGDGLRAQVDNLNRNIAARQRELKVLSNIENQKLEILRTKHKDTYDAVMWLRQNKEMFSGKIYEPIMLCVNMKDQKYARYLENHISFNDMRAFVCENSEDMNLFMDKMREEQKLRVNAVKVPPKNTNCMPRNPIDKYRDFGFQLYLQDTFTCPEPVMKFLCVQYSVQNIPIGDRKTKDYVQRIVEKHRELTCFYTYGNQYSMKASRYSNEVSSRNTKLKDPYLLTKSVDEQKEQEVKQSLKNEMEAKTERETEYRQLQQQSKDLDKQLEQLRNEKKTLMNKKDLKKRLVHQIEAKKQTIRNVESEAVDLDAEEVKVSEKVAEINKKKRKYLLEYLEYTEKCVAVSGTKVRLSLRHAQAVRDHNKLEAELREQSQQLQQLQTAFERSKDRMKTCKDDAQQALDLARKATGTAKNEDISEELKHTFESLPGTLDEIDDEIHENQVRADVTVQTDEAVVHEYNKRKLEIGVLEKNKEDKEQEMTDHQQMIDEAKQLWLDPLLDLLQRINKTFSYFFSCLNCVGEVDLRTPDNPEEYSKYGIRIRVKFRDTETLRELSPHHQSGGERSVTTVLYMMALQELTKCPFRCVDEINQGMDPANERKIFELVVKTVCQKSSSQYFLLTPKLLSDLEYASNMTVLCVFNGPAMMDHKDWNIQKFLKRRSRLD